MIWIVAIVITLIALVALMAGIGLALPRGHVAARAATLATPPGEVWAVLVDRAAAPSWRKDVAKVELLPEVGGKPAFREHGASGKITYVVDEAAAPAADHPGRLVTRIADESLPFGGRWIFQLAGSGAGSRLVITEDGFVGNPIFRLLSRTVFSPTATLETFLRALGTRLGQEVTPEPATPAPRSAQQ